MRRLFFGMTLSRLLLVGALTTMAALLVGVLLLRPAPVTPMPLPPPVVALTPAVTVALDLGAVLPADALSLDWTAAGRFRADADGGMTHEWPGFSLLARFEGDAVLLQLDDAVNRYRLTVDDVAVAVLTRPGSGVLRVAGLGAGPHRLRLDRLSEAWEPARIVGLAVPAPGRALEPPAPPARRIDVYGDSDSVGFGNTHAGRDCPGEDIFLTTDTTLAWPALLAARHAAAAEVVARSGIGLVRNYENAAPGQAMNTLRDRILPSDPAEAPAVSPAWLTIIAIGDNDFAGPVTAGEAWADTAGLTADFAQTFDTMLRDLLMRSPGRPILVVLFAEAGEQAHGPLTEVSARLAAEGAPVIVVRLPALARTGCAWHPSLADHRLMTDTLAAAVDDLIARGLLEAP